MKKALLCLAVLTVLLTATTVPTFAAPDNPICPPIVCN